MSQKLIQTIKQAAIEAVEQSSPVGITYGIVTKINPLEINIEQRMNISADFILLTTNVINKETEISINDGAKNKTIIFNALKAGDKVLLLRVQGGQKYIVLDRLVEA